MFQIRNYALINYRRVCRISTHKLLSDSEFDDTVLKEEDETETNSNGSSYEYLDEHNNNLFKQGSPCPKMERCGREKDNHTIKSALFELRNPLNVLVLGPHDSGKTTVINSLLMAVRKVWSDRAPYGHGGKHQFSPVLLYENPSHHPKEPGHDHKHNDPKWKRNPTDPCGRVTFWDTRGFDLIYEPAKASLILRYILEGRLNHHNFNQALMQSTESLKSMYAEGNIDLQIDLVLYVSSARCQPNMRYFEVIKRAKAESKLPTVKTVPILTVLTKYDLLTPDQITAVDENMTTYHPNSITSQNHKNLNPEEVTPYHVMAYHIDIDPDENMAIPPTPCPKRDANMLKLFMEILALALPRGRRRGSSEIQIIFNRIRARLRRTRHRSSSSQSRMGSARDSDLEVKLGHLKKY